MGDKLRKPVPHMKDFGLKELDQFLAKDTIAGYFTEKPDGMAFEVGCDVVLGFYTRTSTSPKIRVLDGYKDYLSNRFGDKFKPELAEKFDHIHSQFMYNRGLSIYLRQQISPFKLNASLKGEVFYRPSAKKEDGCLVFETIPYNPYRIGIVGTFVIHSALTKLDIVEVEKFTNINMKIEDDIVSERMLIDVSAEKSRLAEIDRAILQSRRQKYAEAKNVERKKLQKLAEDLAVRFRQIPEQLCSPKWGEFAEGYIFHPEGMDHLRSKMVTSLFTEKRDGRKYQGPTWEVGSHRRLNQDYEKFAAEVQESVDEFPYGIKRLLRS